MRPGETCDVIAYIGLHVSSDVRVCIHVSSKPLSTFVSICDLHSLFCRPSRIKKYFQYWVYTPAFLCHVIYVTVRDYVYNVHSFGDITILLKHPPITGVYSIDL